jgi:hypothetical protein
MAGEVQECVEYPSRDAAGCKEKKCVNYMYLLYEKMFMHSKHFRHLKSVA